MNKLILLLSILLLLPAANASEFAKCINNDLGTVLDSFDLSNYPDFFYDSNGDFDAIIVWSDLTAPDERSFLTANEIAEDLEVDSSKIIEASEVDDIFEHNAILLGSPCVNYATAEILGNPEFCAEDLDAGKGSILLKYENNHVYIIIQGYSKEDFLTAVSIFKKNRGFKGTEMITNTETEEFNRNSRNFVTKYCFCGFEGECIPGPACIDDDLGDVKTKGLVEGLETEDLNSYYSRLDYCINGELTQFYCENGIMKEGITICEGACGDGVCLEPEQRSQINEPSSEEDSQEIVDLIYPSTCVKNENTYEKGDVQDDEYCDGNKFYAQRYAGDVCEEDYQCRTGICEETCKQKNIFSRFFSWLGRVF